MYIFFFNDTATTEIYTLSLHDALPIFDADFVRDEAGAPYLVWKADGNDARPMRPTSIYAQRLSDDGTKLLGKRREILRNTADRKSTRLNSSHANISYAVFCLKKKNNHS